MAPHGVPLPFDVAGAVRFDDQAEFHPLKYLLGLAARLSEHGCRIFEQTVATGVSDGAPAPSRPSGARSAPTTSLSRPTSPSSGDGRVLARRERQVAVSRDMEGVLRAVSARCTHLGCIVNWNDAERSWDCPCHGSRFAPDGTVLQGPATQPLQPEPPPDGSFV